MKRITNEMIADYATEIARRNGHDPNEFSIMDIQELYIDLRNKIEGSDGWQKFGTRIRGGVLLNRLSETRAEAISDMMCQ